MAELNKQEEIVKRYLDEQIKNDEALRALYVPAKIKDCFKYIKEQARKQAVNGSAFIDAPVVFKWARDYYLEDLPKKADKKDIKTVTTPKISAETQALLNKADKVIAEKKEVTVIKNGVKYDKNGLGLLFDDLD